MDELYDALVLALEDDADTARKALMRMAPKTSEETAKALRKISRTIDFSEETGDIFMRVKLKGEIEHLYDFVRLRLLKDLKETWKTRPASLVGGTAAMLVGGVIQSEVEDRLKAYLGLKDSFEWLADEIGTASGGKIPIEVRGMVAAFGAALEEATVMSITGLATGPLGTAARALKGSPLLSVFGKFPKFAGGGRVTGSGGPLDDKIPAMLSNGEFVVNAASTARYRGLLEAINSGAVERLQAGTKPSGDVSAAVLQSFSASASEKKYVANSIAAMSNLRVAASILLGISRISLGLPDAYRATGEELRKMIDDARRLAEVEADLSDVKLLGTLPDSAKKKLVEEAEELRDGLTVMAEKLREGRRAYLEAGRQFVAELESTTKQAFADLFRAKKQDENISVVKSFFKTLADGVSNAIINQFISGFVQGMKDSMVGKGVEEIGKGLFNIGADIVKSLFGWFSSGTDTAKDSAATKITGATAATGGNLLGNLDYRKVFEQVEASFGDLPGMFDDLWGSLKSMFGGLNFEQIGGQIMQWAGAAMKFFAFAEGGMVRGPGTGISDSIPAMLSHGEFVVNAAATRRFLPILTRMNSDLLPRFSEGGLVGATPVILSPEIQPGKENGRSTVINLNITGDISRQTRAEIAAMIPNIAEGVNMHNREKGYA